MIAALIMAAAAATASAHHSVTTADAVAQQLFDRGLTHFAAYDSDAAADAFAQAAQRDPQLAVAYAFAALALGPNLNESATSQRFALAQAAARRAQAVERYARPEERAFIDAVSLRYAGNWSDFDADQSRYRMALSQLVAAYPRDDDAASILAEAYFEERGTSRLWDGSVPAYDDARAGLELLSRVLARTPQHLLANHLCVHAYDYAEDRAPALRCADRLVRMQFSPQDEHLAHMPAHTYIEVGRYAQAEAASEHAYDLFEARTAVDEAHAMYGAHDAYVGLEAAMMLASYRDALGWSERFAAQTGVSYDSVVGYRFGQAPAAAVRAGRPDLSAIVDADRVAAAGDVQRAQTLLARAGAFQRQESGAETIPLIPADEALGRLLYARADYAGARDAYAAVLARYPNDVHARAGLRNASRELNRNKPR